MPDQPSFWQQHRRSLLLLLIGVVAGWTLSWHGPAAPPPLSASQERRTRAAVVAQVQAASQDSARGARADSAATHLIRQASLTRHATHSLPARRLPLDSAATVNLADSLTRFLAGY
jgi:hypothetical protein